MGKWKWYVYIVECQDGLYYTGLTWDIAKRMGQHQTGLGSGFTHDHGFKRLCYMEEYDDIHQARRREYQLKDFSRKKKEALWKAEVSRPDERRKLRNLVRSSRPPAGGLER